MLCPFCGAQVNDGAKFCENCGAKQPVPAGEYLAAAAEAQTTPVPAGETIPGLPPDLPNRPAPRDEQISENITLCADGVYRWIYHMNLFKNPTIFVLVWKIFMIVILGICAVMTVVDIIQWPNEFPDNMWQNLKVFGYIAIGATVLVILGYLLYAAIMGGKYSVMFEMDENGVNHKQVPMQAKKAKKIAAATVIAGLASGRLTTVGVGLNSARTEMYSPFDRTRKVKAYPRSHVIKVNGRLQHNQVYAATEDFDFVLNYILSHCENLK